MSMVREVEKLRAELTNANLDRSGTYIYLYYRLGLSFPPSFIVRLVVDGSLFFSNAGGSYSNSGGYKENDTTGQRSVGQNAYEDVYGGPQVSPSTKSVSHFL